MLIGYARVSTQDQTLDRQMDALQAAGCERVFKDTVSGATTRRPGLDELLSHVRSGDVIVVQKLDRLGRSLRHLIELVAELKEKGIHLRSLADGVDTSQATGRLILNLLAVLADAEREWIRERTQTGLEAARKRGRVGGRPRKLTEGKVEAARKLLDTGMAVADVANSVGVSVPTLYRWLPAGR